MTEHSEDPGRILYTFYSRLSRNTMLAWARLSDDERGWWMHMEELGRRDVQPILADQKQAIVAFIRNKGQHDIANAIDRGEYYLP